MAPRLPARLDACSSLATTTSLLSRFCQLRFGLNIDVIRHPGTLTHHAEGNMRAHRTKYSAGMVIAMGLLGLGLQPVEAETGAGDQNNWYYCFDQCPDMNAWCAPRGGLEGAYCSHDPCWGPNQHRWYDWTVECG